MTPIAFRNVSSKMVTAIDIGGSKVSCIIAARREVENVPVILGIGHHGIQSVKKGEALTLDIMESAILHAVHKAEKEAGTLVKEAVINITGNHLLSEIVSVSVRTHSHRIGDQEIANLIAQGTQTRSSDTFTVLHANPIQFAIDDGPMVKDPRGMYGNILKGYLHVVTGDLNPTRTLVHCLQRCHINITSIVPSSIASGLSTLVEDEMELGVILVDLGSRSTNVSVFRDGEVIHTECLPLGSNHITSDLAYGLSTSFSAAERIKVLYGSAVETTDDARIMVEVPSFNDPHREHDHIVPRSLITAIIKPRMEEILELVKTHLEKSDVHKMTSRRVVITGGGSQLSGLRELAQDILQKQVRLGRPLDLFKSSQPYAVPSLATCTGLLTFAFRQNYSETNSGGTRRAWVQSVMGWLKDNF